MAVSFQILVGQTLEQVTVGANAPAAGAGAVEIRVDQTAGAVTDAQWGGVSAGGTRVLKKSEVQALIRILEEAIIRDQTGVFAID